MFTLAQGSFLSTGVNLASQVTRDIVRVGSLKETRNFVEIWKAEERGKKDALNKVFL